MARLVTCGFELNSVTNGLEAAESTFIGSPTITTSKRSGAYALRISSLVSGTRQACGWQFVPTAAAGPYTARAYIYVVAFPAIETTIAGYETSAVGGGPTQRFTLDASGVLRAKETSGTVGSTTLSLNKWYRLEILVDGTPASGARIVRAQVDGFEFATFTTSTDTFLLRVWEVGGNLNAEANATGDWYFDDVAVNDSVGARQNSFPGEGSVCYLRPNGAGDADTGAPTRGGADSGTIEGQLDEETPNGATDFVVLPANPSDFWVDVQAGSVGGIGVRDLITLVEVNAHLSAVSATASNWFPQIKKAAAGTIASATAVAWASAAYFTNDDTTLNRQSKLVNYLDPDGVAWTPGTIDSMQISAKTTDGNPDTLVSAIWAIVEFVPAGMIQRKFNNINHAVRRAAYY